MNQSGSDVARRIEAAQARLAEESAIAHMERCPDRGAAVERVAGGVAVFLGIESPLTHAIGLGMTGPVRAWEIERVENFYRERETSVKFDVCPYADPSIAELLGKRGYRPMEFANVLVADPRTLPLRHTPPVKIEVLAGNDAETWARLVARSFFEVADVTDDLMEIGLILFHTPGTSCFSPSMQGDLVGGGAMAVRDGVALMFADATLMVARNRGAHSALIRARLEKAAEMGCAIATADTLPGSTSQRNYEREGFRVAYTKLIMEKAW